MESDSIYINKKQQSIFKKREKSKYPPKLSVLDYITPPTTKPGNVDPKLCNPVYFTPYSGFVRWF